MYTRYNDFAYFEAFINVSRKKITTYVHVFSVIIHYLLHFMHNQCWQYTVKNISASVFKLVAMFSCSHTYAHTKHRTYLFITYLCSSVLFQSTLCFVRIFLLSRRLACTHSCIHKKLRSYKKLSRIWLGRFQDCSVGHIE